MLSQEELNYSRIAAAIDFVSKNFKRQPKLEEIAESASLSPAHFQRLLTEWAGTSPKNFLQYTSLEYAKELLKKSAIPVSEAAYEAGYSSSSRLHDAFVKIEGMTPAEYKNGGRSLTILYSFQQSPFGKLVVASTEKGICYMAFHASQEEGLQALRNEFSEARLIEQADAFQQQALALFQKDWTQLSAIKLHLKGTPFQLKVWETLLSIPTGSISTYGALADRIGAPKASRAVGSAIASNPVAFLIPCHRVIQNSGKLGGYRWGMTRKSVMIAWEALQCNPQV